MTGDDWERLGDDADRLAHFIGNRAFMKITLHHCAALSGDREGGAFVCSIYERRPQVCRDLERGSPGCEGEIDTKHHLTLLP